MYILPNLFTRFLSLINRLNLKDVGSVLIGMLTLSSIAAGLIMLKPASADRTGAADKSFQQARLSEQVSVHAAGRGNPFISLSDGRDVITDYDGRAELVEALEQDRAEPLSLASADFDEDGVPDLISGYGNHNSGIITLHRGNVDSIYPNSPEAKQRKSEGRFTESPFLSPGLAFLAPEAADFVGAGDFDCDGHWDVVVASRGSNRVYLMSGDGRGGLSEGKAIVLPGAVTALATGEINRRDGLEDVVVAVAGTDGAKALVFEGPEGALRAGPEVFTLPAEATSLALGQMDDEYPMDLAVAAGRELLVVYGRDRKLSLDEIRRAEVQPAMVSRRSFPFSITSIATGDFTGSHQPEIAVLYAEGGVQVIGVKKRSAEDIRKWRVKSTAKVSATAGLLVRARISSVPVDNLVVVDSSSHHLHIVTCKKSKQDEVVASSIPEIPASLYSESEPMVVLPMRLNVDALSDLVILREGQSAPTMAMTQPLATFTVTNTNDDGPGSLRQAIIDANANAGLDTINFSIGSGVQTINVGSSTGIALSLITDPVTIDGTTQPGYGGLPLIELNGTSATGGVENNGLIITAGSSTIKGLVINRFLFGAGIYLASQTTTTSAGGNIIAGNFIGTDVNGTAALSNGNGVFIDGPSNNIIGGTAAGARNVISGSDNDGILIGRMFDNLATGNLVQGNYIGTDATGTADLANTPRGVEFNDAANNTIGGTAAGARNVISGNNGHGILIQDSNATGNLVQGNYIGTDATGTADLGNFFDGVSIATEDNTIGGTAAGARNVISGNDDRGIAIVGTGNQVQGNYIGTDISGATALANDYGVTITLSTGSAVGGAVAGARNIISGNQLAGIYLGFLDSGQTGGTGVTIQNNFIGTDTLGSSALGNGQDGIFVEVNSVTNTIRDNRIAFNGASGVRIPNTTSNPGTPGVRINIHSNLIYSNAMIGIDLGPAGNTANDPRDPDAGANLLQNHPVLTSATMVAPSSAARPATTGTIRLVGNFHSTPNTDFFVQFFSAAQCTNSNPGGDQQSLNFVPILFRTDANGNAPIDITFQSVTIAGGWVNALARDPSSNTSEFSQCIQIDTSALCNNSIGSSAQSFSASGGTDSVTVTAAAGCVWAAVSNDSFITITAGPDGTGNGAVSYQVAANPNNSQRTATMTIAGQTFTVTQQGAPAPCTFSLSSSSKNFTASGGGDSFIVTTQAGCNWTPITDVGWVTATRSGTTVNYLVESNSLGQRQGHITVQDQVFTVTQDAAAVVCLYSLLPGSATISGAGGTGSFTLTTGGSCSWNSATDVGWITVPISGIGGGVIDYTVAANTGGPRMGHIYIEGVQFTINQGGGCGYTLSATSKSFAANGGTGSVSVTAANGCLWTAMSNNPSFITITSGNSGNGNGTVNYSVAANTGPAIRSGTITIAGQTYTVYQGKAFADVPVNHPFYTEIGRLSSRGVTLGCNATNYCPDDVVTRQQMAAFIIRALGDFNPLPPAQQRFLDVPPSNPFYAFIEQMAIRQITLGCGAGNYCPGDPVLRDQMAAFIIRALHPPGYVPPVPAQQRFLDVLPTNPFYAHIEEMAVRQITLGCGGGNYCPSLAVTRGQMAAFLVRAFNL